MEGNVLGKHAKFQLHPPYGFREEDFFFKFTLYIALSTNQIKRFRQKSYEMWMTSQ